MADLVVEARYLAHHLRAARSRNISLLLLLDGQIDWIADAATTIEIVIAENTSAIDKDAEAQASSLRFERMARAITDQSPDLFDQTVTGYLLDQALEDLYKTVSVLVGHSHYPPPPKLNDLRPPEVFLADR